MANDVNRLIDMLYERIEDAKSPALKPNMSMVDRDELLDLLDELRAQLPVEIKRAQELLSAQGQVCGGCQTGRGPDDASGGAGCQDQGVRQRGALCGQGEGPPDGGRAEERCRQLYQVTNEYAEDALARTEEAVQMALDEVKQQRVRFRSASAAKMQEQRDKLDGRTPPQEDGGEE